MKNYNYDVPAKFEARNKKRDKQRKTKMVVDGQGVKRVAKALQDRRWESDNE